MRTITIDSTTGELSVCDDFGKNLDNSPAVRQWTISGKFRQIEKHAMFEKDIAQQLNRGDRQVIADIIAENIASEKAAENIVAEKAAENIVAEKALP